MSVKNWREHCIMKFKDNFFKSYLLYAPLALAIERTWECHILSKKKFECPVLDVGCGDGVFAYNLFGDKLALGIDLQDREIQEARKVGVYARLKVCMASAIEEPSGGYKTIFSNSVLEHIYEIDPVLKEIHRLLDKDGRVFLTLPTDNFEKYGLIAHCLEKFGFTVASRKFRKNYNKFWRHYHCYPREIWAGIFEKHGFRVQETFEYGSRNQCFYNDIFSLLAVFPYVCKKIFNRWFISTTIRKVTGIFLYNKFNCLSKLLVCPGGQGGLIFFELRKV